MESKEARDKEQIGDIDEAGLFLISDRPLSPYWKSVPRRELKPARERLGPLQSVRAVVQK